MAEIGRICTVCTHDERRAINAALVGREPYRNIAKRFGGFSPAALTRHTKNCMPRIVEAGLDAMDQRERKEAEEALDTVRQLRAINHVCFSILNEARTIGAPATALQAIDRIHRQIELQAKLIGDLQQEGTTTNYVFISPAVTEIIARALAPYPEAGYAVSDVLKELEAKGK
jgi:uncharacterized membrane protein YccC